MDRRRLRDIRASGLGPSPLLPFSPAFIDSR